MNSLPYQDFEINYSYIASALNMYRARGFTRIEVPWFVHDFAVHATMPTHIEPYETKSPTDVLGFPVGSAEQSFIEMMERQELSPGKYVAATPCIRNESTVDYLHRKWFMKVELIDTLPKTEPLAVAGGVDQMIEDALWFFRGIVPTGELKVVWQSDQNCWDILSPTGIELGSYGARSWNGHSWIYGTGCAEPRLSQALKLLKNLEKEAHPI